MKSSWPLVLAILGVTLAAFAYDAHNEAAAAGKATPAIAAAVR